MKRDPGAHGTAFRDADVDALYDRTLQAQQLLEYRGDADRVSVRSEATSMTGSKGGDHGHRAESVLAVIHRALQGNEDISGELQRLVQLEHSPTAARVVHELQHFWSDEDIRARDAGNAGHWDQVRETRPSGGEMIWGRSLAYQGSSVRERCFVGTEEEFHRAPRRPFPRR